MGLLYSTPGKAEERGKKIHKIFLQHHEKEYFLFLKKIQNN